MAEGKAGRPTKLDEATATKILELIAAGVSQRVASESAGICPRTLGAWIARGKEESEGPFHDFYLSLMSAGREAEIGWVRLIAEAAKIDWKAAAWLLARKNPEDWSAHTEELRQLRRRFEEFLEQQAKKDGKRK